MHTHIETAAYIPTAYAKRKIAQCLVEKPRLQFYNLAKKQMSRQDNNVFGYFAKFCVAVQLNYNNTQLKYRSSLASSVDSI
ncbi:hypothetical protein V1478_012320 [Vespula squamosa]|uniref:Uncharacterized protein n=1 Tax=Vespula squamosa TaxID=30214 RepID=A0ABD2ACV1_VESSQ